MRSELSCERVKAPSKGRRKLHTWEDKPGFQHVQLKNNQKKENTDDPMEFLFCEREVVYKSKRIRALIHYQRQSRQPCNCKHTHPAGCIYSTQQQYGKRRVCHLGDRVLRKGLRGCSRVKKQGWGGGGKVI